MVKIRIATPSDAESILAIYEPYIVTTSFTFETTLPSVEDFSERMRNCLYKYPWIVCEIDETLAGYAYASVHRDREAYQWTCECSVYLDENFQGKGIGREVYTAVLKILKAQGIVNVYAGITLPNNGSVKLHEKCGFEHFALYDNIGYKFGRWHKVGWWKLCINEYETEPLPPLKFSEMQTEASENYLRIAEDNIKQNLSDNY